MIVSHARDVWLKFIADMKEKREKWFFFRRNFKETIKIYNIVKWFLKKLINSSYYIIVNCILQQKKNEAINII